MRSFRTLLVVVLGLLAATSTFYAWQQQKSLRTARLAAEALEKERTELRKKLWDAERRRNELEGRTGMATAAPEIPDAAAAPLPADAGPFGGGMPDGPMVGRFFAMMDNPEAQRLMALQQRGALDARYSALFRMLNLTPAQLERFKDLLVEKRTAVADVMAAARTQGLTGRENRDELRALVNDAQAEIDASIRASIGETAFQQYQNFEQTQSQRSVVSQLEQRLSYSGTPLTAQQTEQLVQVLAASSGAQSGAAQTRVSMRAANGNPAGMFFTTPAPITDQALAQASTVLAPTQVQALQALQAEQQAQAQLSQLMREQMRGRRGTGNSSPAQPASPPKG